MQYCLPQIPSAYWINKERWRCNACGYAFDLYVPNGDEVVKFVESNGTEIRWLPTHGQGGYLDLFEKLMPGFLASERKIIPPISSQFIKKLQDHVESSEAGNGFEESDYRRACPRCRKQDTEILSEVVLTSPEVKWLKIDCELLKGKTSE